MPSPGDPANLKDNLEEIAALPQSGADAKLDYDSTTKRFSVQKGDLLQGLRRTFSGNSVTNEAMFGEPIRELFASAHRVARQNQEIQNLLLKALSGLAFLRKTYASDASKLQSLNRVIVDANRGMSSDPQALQKLRDRYKKFLVYAFTQGMFLDESCQGVCDAFTLDWARRFLIYNKDSYAVTKHSDKPLANNNTLGSLEKTRMMDKVDNRLRLLQDASVKGKLENPEFGPKNLPGNAPKADDFRRIESQYYGKGTNSIPANASGHAIMSDVLVWARKKVQHGQVGPYSFVVSLSEKPSNKAAAHAIALRLGKSDDVHFFDPNIGEFRFLPGSTDPQRNFWNEWWSLLYNPPSRAGDGEHYRQWRLKVLWKIGK
jgi:hypothetical protein